MSKAPISAHLRQVAKTLGKDPEELLREHIAANQTDLDDEVVDEIPEGFEWYLPAFYELTRGRGSNGFSMLPITWSELLAWKTVNSLDLRHWEIDLLMALDTVWMNAQHDSSSGARTTDQES